MTRRVHVRVFFGIVTLSTYSFVVLPRAFFYSFWNILFNWKCELATWTISLNWLLCCVLSLCVCAFPPTLTLITHFWLFFFIASVHERIKFIILSEHLDELYRASSITASIFFCFFFIHWLPFNSFQWMYQRISITSRRNGPRKKRRNWNEITIWETQWMRVCVYVCMWGVSNFFLSRIVEKAKTRKMRTYVN